MFPDASCAGGTIIGIICGTKLCNKKGRSN